MKSDFNTSMSLTHTWVSLIVGWAIFFILVTGTLSFFNYDLTRWLEPERPLEINLLQKPQDKQIEAMFDFLSKESQEAKEWYIKLPHIKNQTPNGASRTEIVARSSTNWAKYWYFDPLTLEEVKQTEVRQTEGGELFIDLHHKFYYIDETLGIILTGFLAFFTLVAVVSGVIIHKKVFKDFFTFRANKKQRSWIDMHNITGIITLPFVLMIFYTGLVYYSPHYVTIPYKMIEDKKEQRKDEKQALLDNSSLPIMEKPTANIENMIREAEKKYGIGNIAYIEVGKNNTQGLYIELKPPFGSELTRSESDDTVMRFSGVSGEKLEITNEYSTGTKLFRSLVSLHEAWFASYPLRWLYFICGVLACIMTATGMILYTVKRKEKFERESDKKSLVLEIVERLNIGMIVGLLVGISAFFIANRTLSVNMADRAEWEVNILFLTWAFMIAFAFFRPIKKAWIESLYIASISLAFIPILNYFTTNKHLGVTLKEGDFVLAFVDITMLLFALVFAFLGFRLKKKWSRKDKEDNENKEVLIGEKL
ncbi:PepSY domain-containing membrane protein [Aliarcobacter faecis]|uniref:PepSY-associated TM helix domain-containing protein n=3 Tax=Aliarcobacter faecis TaxID=1564138 RepID=UPI00047BEB4D|nr:PepSY-associated TM helix domain-containing protein [Aliarcobacter faecis]QKF73076.1 PepSY domain-containing membrane protein [Aliarcobacter faecis]